MVASGTGTYQSSEYGRKGNVQYFTVHIVSAWAAAV